MRNLKVLKYLLIVSVVVIITLSISLMTNAQGVLKVSKDDDSDYTSIQAAINAASKGDTISVEAGTYDETLSIDKSITLRSPNQDAEIEGNIKLKPGDLGCIIIEGIKVDATDTGIPAITTAYPESDYNYDQLKIKNTTLIGDGDQALYLRSSDSTNGHHVKINEIIINDNNIEAGSNEGIGVFCEYDNLTINGNEITGDGSTKGIMFYANNCFENDAEFTTTIGTQENKNIFTNHEYSVYFHDTFDIFTINDISNSNQFENTSKELNASVYNSNLHKYYNSIQDAVDASSAGNTINVSSGRYAEDIIIDKSIELKGANAEVSATQSSEQRNTESVLEGGIQVQSNNITIDGFKFINGAVTNAPGICGIYILGETNGHNIANNIFEGDESLDSNKYGILFGYNTQNISINNNEFYGWYDGIYINPSSNLTFEYNDFHDNYVGIGSDKLSEVSVNNNFFSNNELEGWGSSDVGQSVEGHYNSFIDNGTALAHYGGETIDATNNWWGSESGPVQGTVAGKVHYSPWSSDDGYTNSINAANISFEEYSKDEVLLNNLPSNDTAVSNTEYSFDGKLEGNGYISDAIIVFEIIENEDTDNNVDVKLKGYDTGIESPDWKSNLFGDGGKAYWGPEDGFPISNETSNTSHFKVKFDGTGTVQVKSYVVPLLTGKTISNEIVKDYTVISEDSLEPSPPQIAITSPEGYSSGDLTNKNVHFRINDGEDDESEVFKSQYKYIYMDDDSESEWKDFSGSDRILSSTRKKKIVARTIDIAGNISDTIDEAIINITDNPIITPNTTQPSTNVLLTISYPKDATNTEYKYDGVWCSYNGEFTVNKNCNIKARATVSEEEYTAELSIDNIDRSSPTISFTDIQDDMTTYDSSVSFDVEVQDKTDVSTDVKVNGDVVNKENGDYSAYLQPGDNTIKVIAKDDADNIAEKEISIFRYVISAVPPVNEDSEDESEQQDEQQQDAQQGEQGQSEQEEDTREPIVSPVLEETTIQADEDTITLTNTIQSNEQGDAEITDKQASKILDKIEQLAEQRDSSGQTEDIETKITIDVQNDTNSTSSEVNVPNNIVEQASNNNIDKVEISTPVAKLNIPTEVVSDSSAQSVTVGSRVVNKDELTPGQRQQVGSNRVYDFDIQTVIGEETTQISNFKSDVEVSLPYTLKPGQNPHNITVFFINDNGELENMQGVYDSETCTVKFSTNHFSKFMVKENKVAFKDIDRYKWAKTAIESLAAKGIIEGRESKIFAPSSNITRAEFTTLIVKMLKLDGNNVNLSFDDVNRNDWYYDSVATAFKVGLIEGKTKEVFAPNECITRQDMAVIMVRALKKVKNISDDKFIIIRFTDNNKISRYAKFPINTAVKYGLIDGYPDNKFRPNRKATRAETATIVYNLYKQIK